MATDTWPTTLPKAPEADNFHIQPKDYAARSQPEIGPVRSRLRATVGGDVVGCSMILSFAERSTLDSFYKTTLVGGSKPFNWVDHTSLANPQPTLEYKFTTAPRYRLYAPLAWRAELALEILP